MASVTSLGICTPSALHILVAEGLLRPDPPRSSYTWLRYPVADQPESYDEEELLVTERAVAWSRAGVLCRLFRFDLEKESVRQALFTEFPSDSSRPSPAVPARGSVQSPALAIRKRPPPASQTRAEKSPRSTTWAHAEYKSNVRTEKRADRRALVVLLKKQLHVFFLAGETHLVPLPFAVAAMFALPSGLAIQRELPDDGPVEVFPSVPSAPYNSFVMSQPSASVLQPSQSQEPVPSIVSKMLANVLNPHEHSPSSTFPAHFYLRDPIADLEPLGEAMQSDEQLAADVAGADARKLDKNERLIYVSPHDERGSSRRQDGNSPLLLAVTANTVAGHYSLWKFSEQRSSRASRKRSSSIGIAKEKFRASFGPGTGATTPTVRKSMGPRESFGPIREATRERNIVPDEAELASQLDPAFENPGAPSRSSRRISSLIARSEMHGGRDTATITDLASSQSQAGGTKRGPSFGGRSARKSFSTIGHERLHKRGSSSHTEMGLSLGNVYDDDETMADTDNDEDDAAARESPVMSLTDTRRLVVSKIHTLRADALRSRELSHKNLVASHKVFTFGQSTAEVEEGSTRISLCIMSHVDNTLHTFGLVASSRRVGAYKQGNARSSVRVKHTASSPQIKDACLLRDSNYSRMVVLRMGRRDSELLSLQSPWSISLTLHLPTRMLMLSPYLIEEETQRRKRRDGSFKRVLSGGPDEMRLVSECPGAGQFCIHDQEQALHQVQVQLIPHDLLIRRALVAAERAMATDAAGNELLLHVWWHMMVLVRQKVGETDDMEWRAFVSTIFALYVALLDKPQDRKPVRAKRKGGLLRSSSGANTNLESFEEAMDLECAPGAATGSWLRQEYWSWVLEPKARITSPSSSQPKTRRSTSLADTMPPELIRKRSFVVDCIEIAREFQQSDAGVQALGDAGYLPVATHNSSERKRLTLQNVLITLHLLREDLKLDVLASQQLHAMTPILAQIGTWMDWSAWGCRPSAFYMLESIEMQRWTFDLSVMRVSRDIPQPFEPPSILQYAENVSNGHLDKPFPTIADVVSQRLSEPSRSGTTQRLMPWVQQLTPRTLLLTELLQFQDSGPTSFIRIIGDSAMTPQILETLPEGVAAPLRSVIVSCQANPGASLPPRILELIDRPDLNLLANPDAAMPSRTKNFTNAPHEASRDYSTISRSTLENDTPTTHEGSPEEDRSVITKLLFSQDQRFGEAAVILHPLKHTVAKCTPEPEWNDTDLLEAQQELAKIVATRTLSVAPGRAMLYYSARFPSLTERFLIHGYSLSCLMKPTNTTVTADKNIYTEEKVSWAFFHAGVEAGLSISKDAKGIDTSWISFNKPAELGNRHAGFLLALGLNGHLKSIAKWVAFKYLTPKHTMTSIGLLLGLAASYLGTMDTLITRLLSVHVVRMLPLGAAELNLSPLTQTTGIMGIGLLYCGTQHRRMSEVMLSEIESVQQDDSINPMENLRDEGYRLAAGFALGYINLGLGHSLKGMRDMHIVERLLALAIATKRVDLVHILDKASAGAIVAIALIFMKTDDDALAKKIDIPETIHQFEYVRPDLFLLRTVARHLIMWDSITPTFAWIQLHLPPSYRDRYRLHRGVSLRSEQLPLFNIIAGLCMSIGLRFAGSARADVRDLLCHYLDQFMALVAQAGVSYDEKLSRIGARNCQDVIALSAAAVMAGTGDLELFRRFRVLHGRTDPETNYGSHIAAHQATGILFLGGGTHSFTTSNLGVASLLCAFYPLFPTSVLDNKCHLQAFRHFWVFAAEPRCLVVRSVETRRPMSLSIVVTLRSGEELTRTAPCLLPELDRVARITSHDPRFWPVSLDLAHNAAHRAAFRQHQSLYVRRRGTYHQGLSVFSATMRALNDRQMALQRRHDAFAWLFDRPALAASLDRAARTLVLPTETAAGGGSVAATLLDATGRGSAIDDRLALIPRAAFASGRAERLWSLRVLFAWEDKMRRVGAADDIAWLGRETIATLRAQVALLGSTS